MHLLNHVDAMKDEHGEVSMTHMRDQAENVAQRVVNDKPTNITLSPYDKERIRYYMNICADYDDISSMTDYEILKAYVVEMYDWYKHYISAMIDDVNNEDDDEDEVNDEDNEVVVMYATINV